MSLIESHHFVSMQSFYITFKIYKNSTAKIQKKLISQNEQRHSQQFVLIQREHKHRQQSNIIKAFFVSSTVVAIQWRQQNHNMFEP